MHKSELFKQTIEANVAQALAEDLGGTPGRDVTAELIPKDTQAKAEVISREAAVLCGQPWVEQVFYQLDPNVKLHWFKSEGETIKENEIFLSLEGNARSLLTGERSALNFLQTLSATATLTAEYVNHLKGTQCQLLDTRKTLPGLRLAQKYAVKVGGGINHRLGLYDAFLIKENHIATCGGITAAINKARQLAPHLKLEIEVENLNELDEALAAKADVIMLDNFSTHDLIKAVELRNKTCSEILLEASGNLTIVQLKSVAQTGVDFISTGALTKNVTAIDLSLRLELL